MGRIVLAFLFIALVSVSARARAAEKMFTNTIGMEFVLVPAGSFVMGENAPLSEGKGDEHPPHDVNITRPFYMGRHEVTQKQWQQVMGTNPSRHKGENNPVDSVSWNDAQEFIKRLNQKEGTTLYRLPTEAEWEYAARGGAKTRYFFGDNPEALTDYAWVTANAGGTTHPVGTKKPNQYGIYDTSGNVREWVQDWYGEDYYSKSPGTDPAGPQAGYGRAYRGGSKDGAEFPTRSSYRWRETPDTRAQNLGFRLARTAPD